VNPAALDEAKKSNRTDGEILRDRAGFTRQEPAVIGDGTGAGFPSSGSRVRIPSAALSKQTESLARGASAAWAARCSARCGTVERVGVVGCYRRGIQVANHRPLRET
jgi:hypothetical protein